MRQRIGQGINLQTLEFGEEININGVKLSLHPAGHIIGSAQVRLEHQGEVWVVSGDYKVDDDGISGAFEPVKCHSFITESTFGLPVFKWRPPQDVHAEINQWWANNRDDGRQSILTCYSLGKAQRLLHHLDTSIDKIYAHNAIVNINEALISAGVKLPKVIPYSPDLTKEEVKGSILLTPGSGIGNGMTKKFEPYSTAAASGWMALRGMRRRASLDRGFVISDHADWHGLNEAVKATEAEKVYVTHGYSNIYSLWLNERGIVSEVVETEYEGETSD